MTPTLAIDTTAGVARADRRQKRAHQADADQAGRRARNTAVYSPTLCASRPGSPNASRICDANDNRMNAGTDSGTEIKSVVQ